MPPLHDQENTFKPYNPPPPRILACSLHHRGTTADIPSEIRDPEDCSITEGGECAKKLKQGPFETSTLSQESFLSPPVLNLVAGGIAGMCAKTVVAPLDRLKILYQTTSRPFSWTDVPRHVHEICQSQGPHALWKSNGATLLRVVPYSGIQFAVYEACKGNRTLTPLESLLAGSVAGLVSVLCTYPLDWMRTQLAASATLNWSLTIQRIRQSPSQVLHGLTPTLLGILPYAGIAFMLNDQGKQWVHRRKGNISTLDKVISGALAGLVAQTVTYPLEVTRRRMQTSPKSIRQTVSHLVATEGVHGLFKGVSMNWIKGPISFGISFTVFDLTQEWLRGL